MASPVDSSTSSAELAICRLVEQTSGHKTPKCLGPACLVFLKSTETKVVRGKNWTTKSTGGNYFVAVSRQVLTKEHLKALEKRAKEKSFFEPSVKIVAEFPDANDKSKIERKTLSKLCRSFEKDVFEMEGAIYMAVEPGRFGKSRALEVVDLEEDTTSSLLSSDQLDCSVLCGERSTTPGKNAKTAGLATKLYNILRLDGDDSDEKRAQGYFLRSKEDERLLSEDEFAAEEKPLGSIILSKEKKFAGFLNFIDKRPSPLIFGSASESGSFNNGHHPLHGTAGRDREEHNKFEREDLVVASGGVFPPLYPCIKEEVRAKEGHIPANTPSTGGQHEADSDQRGVNRGEEDSEFLSGPDPSPPGREKECSGGSGQGGIEEQSNSPIENSYRSVDSHKSVDLKGVLEVVADLPAVNGKEKMQGGEGVMQAQRKSQEIKADQVPPESQTFLAPSGLIHTPERTHSENVIICNSERQGVSAAGLETLGNGIHQQDSARNQFPQQRCATFPVFDQGQLKKLPVKRTTSAGPVMIRADKKFQLDQPFADTILGCLDLLEALGRCLDKEYRYGHCKCWKHLSEHFGISEAVYRSFKFQKENSPTELMFEYLQSSLPDITVESLKDALTQIERNDAISVLINYEICNPPVNDRTLVSSLFNCGSNSDIIGEIALLLDVEKRGLKNWSDLAPILGITRAIFQSFEDSSSENPTEQLFEILEKQIPQLTVKELIRHLEAIGRQDVIRAIKSSTEVTESSMIKELNEDINVMDEVCDMFNTKKRAKKVKGLRHLGNKLKIKKEILDDILPAQEEREGPTEALLQHLRGAKPWLKLTDLVWALHKINRPDALNVLDPYLSDNCIPNLLAKCDCERCQQKIQESL